MKKTLLCGICVALLATVAGAAEIRGLRSSVAPLLLGQNDGIPMPAPLTPVPDPYFSQGTTGLYTVPSPVITGPGYSIPGQPVELYQNVRYRGQRNIAPCAVPTVIQVADPCNKDACCKTCVNVEVCVPPCDPKCVRVTRDGHKVRYDFGKYAVVVRSTGNHVVVHYED